MRFYTIGLFIFISLWLSLPKVAQRPDAPEFGVRGAYAVGTHEFVLGEDRRLSITIWYPAENPDNLPQATDYRLGILRYDKGRALRDAPPLADGAPYPIVIFSHGSGGYRFQSTFLTEHLASYGFIVISADHLGNTVVDALQREAFIQNIPNHYALRPQDVIRQIAFAEEMNANGDFMGLLDVNNIAVMGHSFGGYTALLTGGAHLNFDKLRQICDEAKDKDFFANACFVSDYERQIAQLWGYDTPPSGIWEQITDSRIKAVIALAPWNAPVLSIPENYPATLIIVGTADMTTPHERDAREVYHMLQGQTATYIELENGGHYLFVDECFTQAIQFGFFSSCSDLVWDMARAHDLINHFVTAFLLGKFYGNTATEAIFNQENPFVGVNVATTTTSSVIIPTTAIISIESVYPHDTTAFTQGLVFHNGLFYESTGLYGQSSLREVLPETGEVLRVLDLPPQYFAEGLALVDNRLIQLTWRENIAFVYDLDTFEQIDTYEYAGEGWGLCYDGEFLYMSDGSSIITQRDPLTFETLSQLTVTYNNQPIDQLNELECPSNSDFIMANIWRSPYLVTIDKASGAVHTLLDGSELVNYAGEQLRNSDSVLNGTAYDKETNTWYMTGKRWGNIFVVTWE